MNNKLIYTNSEVEDLIFKTIRATMSGMMNWIASEDTFIVDKISRMKIENCEIDCNKNIVPSDYIFPELKKQGNSFNLEIRFY